MHSQGISIDNNTVVDLQGVLDLAETAPLRQYIIWQSAKQNTNLKSLAYSCCIMGSCCFK